MKKTILRVLWNAFIILLLGALTAPAVTPVETFFIYEQGTFSNVGDWWSSQFTVGQTQTFVLRFVSDYSCDAAIVTSAQYDNFINNRSFSGYALFDNSFGTQSVTLAHTSKTITFQGALTPLREEDEAEGRGFFLWQDTSEYETGKYDKYGDPVMQVYKYNSSFDFLLFAE